MISTADHFRRGERLFKAEDYESAIAEFTSVTGAAKFVSENPDAILLVKVAKSYLERARELAAAWARDRGRGIKQLFERANMEFEAGRYERAELACTQMLKIDPNSNRARELYGIARAAKHAQKDKRNLDVYREEWMKQSEASDRTIPGGEAEAHCEWPVGTEEHGEKHEDRVSPEDLEIANRMKAQNISLNFSETPLPEVISWLREFTNLNIVLKGVDDPAGIKVTFRADGLPFDQAFDLILRMWELGYEVEQGVIVVTTRAKLESETVFQLHRVQDLTGVVIDFPAPEINLAPPSEDAPIGGAAPPPPVGWDELIELVKGNIAKGTWDTAPNSIEINNGLLIVRHVPFVQRQIQTFLEDLRRSGLPSKPPPALVTYDVRDLLQPTPPGIMPEAVSGESLVEKVRAQVGVEAWTDASRSIAFSGGFLLVRAEQDVQQKVSALLDNLRAQINGSGYVAGRFTYIHDYEMELPQDEETTDPIPEQ